MARSGGGRGGSQRPSAGTGNKLTHLRELAAAPREQIDYALELVATQRQQDIVEAALGVIAEAGDQRIRRTLLDRYTFFAADGIRRDAGCGLRAALLRALRHHAVPGDIPLLEQALSTYEFMPPTRAEVAADLRAAALVALAMVDPALASYRAVSALYDAYTSRLTGEPAVTAARVLASGGHELSLYAYVIQEKVPVAEVAAECLRQLTGVPTAVLAPLMDRCLEDGNDVVLVGLFDLMLTHQARDTFTGRIVAYLDATRSYDLFRYLAAAIVAAHRDDLTAELRALEARGADRRKAEIVQEILGEL